MVVNVNLMVICDTYHENGSRTFLQNINVFDHIPQNSDNIVCNYSPYMTH
jgi:hypothetical protein